MKSLLLPAPLAAFSLAAAAINASAFRPPAIRGLRTQQHRQRADTALNDLRREDREIVWPDEIKSPLTALRLDAVRRDANDAHELARGLALTQLLFLLSIHGSSLHS